MLIDVELLRKETLHFIQRLKLSDKNVYTYRYSISSDQPTLYASSYAVMTQSLYGDLNLLSQSNRDEWAEYFNRHQNDDGLFRDPVIFDQGWYVDDPFWCGRPHLTCHILTALDCLGGVAVKPFVLVDEFALLNILEKWLEARDWGLRISWTGNEILNLGTLLQYSRDFHNDDRAAWLIERMFDWLDVHYLNPKTGVWGELDTSVPLNRSNAVQAAYHLWLLYFYDRRPIPYIERVVDTLLTTQNEQGGFGWGVHNKDNPFNSSACEDIDSIDPLARISLMTDYRNSEIISSMERVIEWVMLNQSQDGGFVFMLDRPFEYGHPELGSEKNVGAMFPTWFRTLAISLIGKALRSGSISKYNWQFSNCPGIQFWRGNS